MARPHNLSPGRPPDLTPPSTIPDSFTFAIRGHVYVNGLERTEMNDYRYLEQLINEKFAGRLTIVKFDQTGRQLYKRNTKLPSAGASDLALIVAQHPGQNIYFYTNALFNIDPKTWSQYRDVAYRRTRSLVTIALREYTIERRFAADAAGTAVYFPLGHANAKEWPATRADARREYVDQSVSNPNRVVDTQ